MGTTLSRLKSRQPAASYRQPSWLYLAVGLLLWLAFSPSTAWGASRDLSEDILTYLSKGYEELAQNRLSAAQAEFAKVIQVDFDNPFANNNLAVIMEKQGRWQDALAYLKLAEKYAPDYLQQVETLYLIGGVVAAVKPEKAQAPQSQVASIIAENKRKLKERLGVADEAAGPPAAQ
jgi:Tfp pilus assembly protein PilF